VEISREDVQIADLSKITLQRSERKPSRVLVVGWNARIVSLVAELKDHASGKLYLTSLSAMSTQQRQRLLRGLEGDDVEFDLIEGSPSDLSDLRRIVEEFDPEAVVIMSSEVVGDPHRADAQALICYLHLDGLLSAKGTPIVVELFFPEDADSFELSANTDIIATDSMIAYFLSQVALRPEIADAYYGLLGAQGARLDLLDYDVPKDTSYSFNQVFQALSQRNIIMIGYLHGKDTHLVPPMDRILPNNSRLVVVCGDDSDLAAPN